MKRNLTTICLILILAFVSATAALATEKKLAVTVNTVTEGVTSNGAPYIRAIIEEARELNGEPYSIGVPLMFFNSNGMYEAGRALKSGDKITVIAQPRDFNGRMSYTALKIVQ